MAENKGELEQYQEIQSQINNVNAQRQQNFTAARASTAADSQNASLLHQAGTVMAQAEASVGEETQQTLSKYGVQKPKTVSTSSQQKVNNTTIINNNTTVNNYGGPVQGRALAFKNTSSGETNKFKVWLDNLLSKRNNENARRNRDYEKRERNLMKDSSRLMNKLSDIGKNISNGLDPRRIGATLKGQLKNLLVIFGIATIAKNFKKILVLVDGISSSIKEFFSDSDGKKSKLGKSIVRLLGGNPEQETVGEAFKNFFTNKDGTGLFDGIKLYFSNFLEDRANAIKSLKIPHLGLTDFTEGLQFFADVIACALGGTRAAQKIASRGMRTQATAESNSLSKGVEQDDKAKNFGYKDESGKKIDAELGDLKVIEGNHITENDLDIFGTGHLKNNTTASVVQGKTLDTIINDTDTNQVHTLETLTGLQRLKETSRFHKEGTLVDESFFETLKSLGYAETAEAAKKKLIEKFDIKSKKYKFATRNKKRSDETNKTREAWNNAEKIGAGVGAAVLVGVAAAATGGIGLTAAAGTATAGAGAGYASVKVAESAFRDKGKYIEMIPMEEDVPEGETTVRDSTGALKTVDLYSIPAKAFSDIEKEINIKFDPSNVESINKMDEKLTEIKENNLKAKISSSKEGSKTQENYKNLLGNIQSDTASAEYGEAYDTISRMNDVRETAKEEWEDYKENSRVTTAGKEVAEVAKDAYENVKDYGKGVAERAVDYYHKKRGTAEEEHEEVDNTEESTKSAPPVTDSTSKTNIKPEEITKSGSHVSLLSDDTLHFSGKGVDFARDMAEKGKYIGQSDRNYHDFSKSIGKCSTGAFQVLGALLGKDFNIESLDISAKNAWNSVLKKWRTHKPLNEDGRGNNVIDADTLKWEDSNRTYHPKVGDVAVWGLSCPSDYPGHMATYLGPFKDGKGGWVSDFRQNGCGVYDGAKKNNDYRVRIYRLNEENSVSQEEEEKVEETAMDTNNVEKDSQDVVTETPTTTSEETTPTYGSFECMNCDGEVIPTKDSFLQGYLNRKYSVSLDEFKKTGDSFVDTEFSGASESVSDVVKESTETQTAKKTSIEKLESKQEAINDTLIKLAEVSKKGAEATGALTDSMTTLSSVIGSLNEDEIGDGRKYVELDETRNRTRNTLCGYGGEASYTSGVLWEPNCGGGGR